MAFPEYESEVLEENEIKEPSMYRVMLFNDDYTPMEFVVCILMEVFGKNESDARKVMLDVHRKGAGICGVFIYEIAETKVYQVIQTSEKHGYPLKCEIEEE